MTTKIKSGPRLTSASSTQSSTRAAKPAEAAVPKKQGWSAAGPKPSTSVAGWSAKPKQTAAPSAKDEIKQQRNELTKQRQALDASAATYDAEKQRLDAELEKNKAASKQHREEAQPVIDFLGSFANTERLAANGPKKIGGDK